MPVRALIFDLDDTLVDSRAAYAFALGIALGQADAGRMSSFAAARAKVKARLPARHVAARNRWLYFKEMLESTGSFTTKALLELTASYENALVSHIASQWASLGRLPLFERLSGRFPLAVVTNESLRTQVLKLRAMDPSGGLFRCLVTSEELGVEKPDPLPLRTALANLGVKANETVVIGNSMEDDVEPALAAGCRVVWTTEFEPDADRVSVPWGQLTRIAKLAELEAHLGN